MSFSLKCQGTAQWQGHVLLIHYPGNSSWTRKSLTIKCPPIIHNREREKKRYYLALNVNKKNIYIRVKCQRTQRNFIAVRLRNESSWMFFYGISGAGVLQNPFTSFKILEHPNVDHETVVGTKKKATFRFPKAFVPM